MQTILKLAALAAIAASVCGCQSLRSVERASTSSVIRVSTDGGHGTGFPITKHCVVTAAHVVDGEEKTVRIAGPDKVDHKATVLRENKDIDVAVVCAPSISMVPVKLASGMPEQYANVYVIGNPLTFENILTEGVYQGGSTITAPIAPGNSGGPVFNTEGEVIGLADAIAVYQDSPMSSMVFPHLGTVVTIDTISSFIKGIV